MNSLGNIFLLMFLLITSLFVFVVHKIKITRVKIITIIFFVLLIGIWTRIYSFYYFDTVQISDFYNPERLYMFLEENGEFVNNENTLLNTPLQNNFSLFPTWYVYSSFISIIFKIIGYNPFYIKIFNLILYAFTSMFAYFGIKNMFSNKISLITIFIFAICPSMIIYSNVASPEFLLKCVSRKYHFKLIATKIDIKTGKVIGKNCCGMEKVRRLNEIGIYKCTNFYSDSFSDAPLKEISENAFIVKGEKLIDWK